MRTSVDALTLFVERACEMAQHLASEKEIGPLFTYATTYDDEQYALGPLPFPSTDMNATFVREFLNEHKHVHMAVIIAEATQSLIGDTLTPEQQEIIDGKRKRLQELPPEQIQDVLIVVGETRDGDMLERIFVVKPPAEGETTRRFEEQAPQQKQALPEGIPDHLKRHGFIFRPLFSENRWRVTPQEYPARALPLGDVSGFLDYERWKYGALGQ